MKFSRTATPLCEQYAQRATVTPQQQPAATSSAPDERAQSCVRTIASTNQIRLEADRFGPSLKAGPDGRFSADVRASLERICPSLRQHRAAMDADCGALPQSSDRLLRDMPSVEAEAFLRETLPVCDQFQRPAGNTAASASNSAPAPSAQTSQPAAKAPDEFDLLLKDCISRVTTALQPQFAFQDYFSSGEGKAAMQSGKMTSKTLRYFDRFCPRLRNAAGFREPACAPILPLVADQLGSDVISRLVTFYEDIGKVCDTDHKPVLMTAADYQTQFDREVRRKRYPETVSAVCENGEPRFSAVFEPFPKGRFAFFAHHGVSDEAFRRHEADYAHVGFKQVWHNRIECGGRAHNQAVWTRQ